MKRTRFLGLAGGLAAGVPAVALAQITPNRTPYLQQLTIGVNVTMSGPLGKYGTDVARGAQAAVDEANRFNPPIGRAWGLRSFDDRNDAGIAPSNVSVASADTTIVGMIGNLTAPMTLASLSRYANVNFAVVVPTVTADVITRRGFHNVFRLPASDSAAGRLFASAVLPEYRGAFALAVALDGDYGFDIARAFVAQAKADHHAADVVLFPVATVDPAAAARTILDRNPGYVFLCGKTAQLGPIVEALTLARYTGSFGFSDGFYNPATVEKFGTSLAGSYVSASLPPLDRVPSAVGILPDLEQRVGAVNAFIAYGYAAAQIFINVAQRSEAETRFSMLTALQRATPISTLVGNYSFGTLGDPLIPDMYLYKLATKGFVYDRPAFRTGFVL